MPPSALLASSVAQNYTCRYLSRGMSSLAPGRILPGTNWNYRIVSPVSGDNTHQSTVFKAKLIPHKIVSNAPKWAIIKAASPENAIATENLERELATYRLHGVSEAGCFRKIYDVIDNSTIAVEWLDTTLADVKFRNHIYTYALIKASLCAALSSCAVLDDQNHVNTDYKPANILLSGIGTSRITAKVGDLGLVFPAGERIKAQPLAMRAPEVFLGQACNSPSQVWAIAAMLLCWIKPGILGAHDSPHSLINEAWCMAKLKRRFPDWKIPSPDKLMGATLQVAVESAIGMSREVPQLLALPPAEEEMQKVGIPQALIDLLCLMLVTNPEKRPSAWSVLRSTEFQAFDKTVGL